jgi:hypothetical protein
MLVMVLYLWLFALAMFVTRTQAVRKNRALVKYFKVYDPAVAQPSEFLLRMGQHYDNLFQLPILFLVTGGICLQQGLEGPLPVALAWAFVATRALHTYIHLGSNHILRRAGAFALGWICVVALWLLLWWQS